MTETQTSSKQAKVEDPYRYTDEQEYFDKQKRRAKYLLTILFTSLFLTVIGYLALHLRSATPETFFPIKWLPSDVEGPLWQDRALDWLLWGFAGTILFLLREVAHYYKQIWGNAQKGKFTDSFIEYTPWYWINLIKGPVIALVIMFFLNTAQLKLSGSTSSDGDAFNFNFGELDHRVSLVFAFIFGYYSRVARHVLNDIVSTLFPKAWAQVYESFTIQPKSQKVLLGDTVVFKTTPATDVVWSAALGDIDSTGKYTAPKDRAYCGDRAVITAVSTGTRSVAQSASITLVPFKIQGPTQVKRGRKYTFGVSPDEKGLIWTISPTSGQDLNPDTGEYIVPAADVLPDKKVVLTAKKKAKVRLPDGTQKEVADSIEITAVSYTHLTLPTILLV